MVDDQYPETVSAHGANVPVLLAHGDGRSPALAGRRSLKIRTLGPEQRAGLPPTMSS